MGGKKCSIKNVFYLFHGPIRILMSVSIIALGVEVEKFHLKPPPGVSRGGCNLVCSVPKHNNRRVRSGLRAPPPIAPPPPPPPSGHAAAPWSTTCYSSREKLSPRKERLYLFICASLFQNPQASVRTTASLPGRNPQSNTCDTIALSV